MTYLACFIERLAGAAKTSSGPLHPAPRGSRVCRDTNGGSNVAGVPELDRRLPRTLRRDGWWLES